MARVTATPTDVERSLQGISFPASKDELIRRARDNDADQDVLDTLRTLPEGTYASVTEVTQAMADMI